MGDDKRGRKRNIHIGLIPDGNRRYAQKKGQSVWLGHWDGVKKIKQFTKWCLEYPEIKSISIFALSTENLDRAEREVEELWKVYKREFENILTDPVIRDNRVKVRIVGDDGLWKPDIKDAVKNAIDSTKHYSKHILNILLAYGSNFELSNAVKKIAGKPIAALDKFLLVKEPLDLVIRTGGQRRLSNFMLYQASYAEIYFSDTMWPDFSKKEFRGIMEWYFHQQKKFGR